MRSKLDTIKSFISLQEAIKTGEWYANLPRKEISFSYFPLQVFELKKNPLSLQEFMDLLPPGSQEETLPLLREFILFPDNYEEYFLLQVPQGYQKVRMKAQKKFVNEKKETCIKGLVEIIGKPQPAASEESLDAERMLDRFLGWQRSFTRTLPGLSDHSSDYKVVPHLLEILRQNFGAEGAQIFLLDINAKTGRCLFESLAGYHTPTSEMGTYRKFEEEKWWGPVLDKNGVCGLYETELPGPDSSGKNKSKKALMVAPLCSGDTVWGCLILSRAAMNGAWRQLDQQLFRAASSIIGVCLTLSRAEETSSAHNLFLNKLFRHMPLGYVRMQLIRAEKGSVVDLKYIETNPVFNQLAGTDTADETGNSHPRILSVFTQKTCLDLFAKAEEKGVVQYLKAEVLPNQRAYDLTIYSPSPGEIVVLLSDVTDFVRITDALRKGEEELNKVYTNLPVGIELYDKEGYMIEVNEKELEIQKVPDKAVLLGRNLFDHPSLPPFAYEALKKGQNVTFDINLDFMKVNREYYGIDTLDDLKYLTIKYTVLRDNDGEIDNYLLIIVDNTEMYETSLRLREFESAFNSVAEIAEMGFFRWDPLNGSYFGSEQFYKNMGMFDRKQTCMYFEECFHALHPEDHKWVIRQIRKAVAHNLSSFTCEFRVRQEMRWKWMRLVCHGTHYDRRNKVVQFSGINYNIQEVKKAERKLIESKKKAEESDRFKSAFLMNMGNEVRLPLQLIREYSEELGQTKEAGKKQQLVSAIKKNNDQLLNMISDILELSGIESGSRELKLQYIRVDELCAQEINSFAAQVPPDIKLVFIPGLPGQDPVICHDGKWISLILHQILNNAIKFTEKGSIELTHQIGSDTIVFSVKDSGAGIAPEDCSRIFQRFIQLDPSIPGTGLGLSICKSMVERLHGKIGVHPHKGKGSCFWFSLPLLAETDGKKVLSPGG